MGHIDGRGGRFVTVMPRSRTEDGAFRDWLQTHTPVWTEAVRRPGARLGDPDEVYCHHPGADCPRRRATASSGCTPPPKPAATRPAGRPRTEAGIAALDALHAKLAGPRSRLKTRVAVEQAAAAVLADAGADRWVTFTVGEITTKTYKQAGPGRPGASTNYRKSSPPATPLSADIELDRDRLRRRQRRLLPADHQRPRPRATPRVLAAYRYQPNLERRHHLLKSVQDAAPILLHSPARIEALFCCQFLALLLAALIEREVRDGMRQRRPGQHRALPRAPRLQRALHRTDPGDLRRRRPPPTTPRRNPRADLPTRTQRPAAASPRPTRPAPQRLHAADVIGEITRARSAERQAIQQLTRISTRSDSPSIDMIHRTDGSS